MSPKNRPKPTPKFDLKMINKKALFRCCYRFSNNDKDPIRSKKCFFDASQQFGDIQSLSNWPIWPKIRLNQPKISPTTDGKKDTLFQVIPFNEFRIEEQTLNYKETLFAYNIKKTKSRMAFKHLKQTEFHHFRRELWVKFCSFMASLLGPILG